MTLLFITAQYGELNYKDMSLQTKPIQLKDAGNLSKIATVSNIQIPSGICAHEDITDASTAGFTAAGVPYFSVMPKEDGDIALTTADDVTVVYPALTGIPIVGAFKAIVAAGTTINKVIAFV